MAQSIVSVRMDDQLKQDFDAVCGELGLTMSTAVTLLAKKMTREKRLPFEVSLDPFYSAANIKALNESMEQMRQGKTVVKTLDELDALADE
ncbi:MAG: type II toxin-antitoxin system RelB/DinJ family antitoxin [Oscillospiraceae bacterium]|nr:type II toxin-antitoxin system RelB/DinJ family antitoxin [Oscillospiraceae bacterium]